LAKGGGPPPDVGTREHPPGGTRVGPFRRVQICVAHKFRRGDALSFRLPRKAVLTAACILLVAAAGCGEDGGVAEGARVSAYVEGPLCEEARRELVREGGRAGLLRVRAICLPSPRERGRLSLATVGANARRASEDSTAVAYIAEPDPAATRFSRPILESAGIAQISSSSGSAAMARVLQAIREADTGSLRDSVHNVLR
jgi:hypothetical protein